MLKDRRELIENELRKLHSDAQSYYLTAIQGVTVGKTNIGKIRILDHLRERIMSLEFDLKLVNELIDQGHE